MNWIKDKKPVIDTWVLAAFKDRFSKSNKTAIVEKCLFNGVFWELERDGIYADDKFLAWMPIPEYKDEI